MRLDVEFKRIFLCKEDICCKSKRIGGNSVEI